MRRILMLVVLAVLAAATVAEAAPFPKSRNYMSAKGYARWQNYLTTGTWTR